MSRIKDKRAPVFQYGGRPLGRRPRDHGYDIDLNVLAQGFSVSLSFREYLAWCDILYDLVI